jgi:excisionase family DNA binding protein
MDKTTNKSLVSVKLLKATEVANLLNISRAFVYQLMSQGELSFIKIGNAMRIHPIDLQNYISTNHSNQDRE